MTGPHLTPEREAERTRWRRIFDQVFEAFASGGLSLIFPRTFESDRDRADRLAAALDAEREAHHLTRTALEASTVDLAVLARALRGVVLVAGTVDAAAAAEIADARAVENQRVLGLAVAEADKPHDGNER